MREETIDLLEPERDSVSTVIQVGLVDSVVKQEDWNRLPVLLNRKCPLPLSSLAVAGATSKSGEGSRTDTIGKDRGIYNVP